MDKKPEDEYKWYHDNVDHTPMHPHHEWVVDRCADRCDDQLPLFSQVGRGLQGNGFEIEVEEDDQHTWTILKGYEIDPHTGEKTEKWRTDNINGGKLTHRFIYNPVSNPKTFQIEFTLTRPDGLGWTDITPAIPYLWDDEASVGVATLFVKKKGSPSWSQITIGDSDTPHSISEAVGEFEKLIYPPLKVRSEYQMPQPGDPWTVNLEYGKGADIDVPTTSEEEADIAAAKQQVLEHLHKDLGGGEGLPDVTESSLKPLKGDNANGKTVWDWIQYAIQEAKDHLHKDLYGGPNSTDYASIPASLKPLDGDNDNGKTVWDWIKYAYDHATELFNKVTDPTPYEKDLGTLLNRGIYLVMLKPYGDPEGDGGEAAIPSKITTESGRVLAYIPATVTIQFYDSIPDTIISVTPKNVNASGTYSSDNHVNFGVGEMLVVCTADNTSFYPINLRALEIPVGEGSAAWTKHLKPPTANPETLVNSGMGPIGTVAEVSANSVYSDYQSYCVPNDLGPVFNDGATCYGNWAIYTGVGNPVNSPNKNSRSGGWPWKKPGDNAPFYVYLFNRSTGYLGPRVWVDYARGYDTSYR